MACKPCSSGLRKLLHLLALLWVAISAAHGQTTWRSTLYPANWQPPGQAVTFASAKLIQDFSYAGYRRGEELLPAITGPIFDVTQFGADPSGATDSTVAIQSAINAAAAAGGGVVFLPAGEFRVSPQGGNNQCLRVNASNIVIRGAGTTQTFLLNTSHTMRGRSVIRVAPPSTSLGPARTITANLPGPTRRIPVENAGSFAAGNIVRLQWSFTSDWVTENKQQTWWGDSSPGSARYYREVVAVSADAGWIESSGDVVITVNAFVPPDPFDQWVGAPGTSFVHDSNADGLADGLAWLLGAQSPESDAATLLPVPRRENGELSVTFNYLIPASRGSYSMRLQHSSTLAPESWTDVVIPDAPGTVGGVRFFIAPLPGGELNEIQALVPAGPAGRVFVRLSATVPGS